MTEKSEVLQGTLDLMILKTLHALGPQHGFGIARRIEQISEQALKLNEGTVYTSLLRLQQKGWISSEWGISENNRKARLYSITKRGQKQLVIETANREIFSGIIGRVLRLRTNNNCVSMAYRRPLDPQRQRYIAFNSVGQSFFKTMGISILNGRPFDGRDTSRSPAVAVINRALAQKEFPGKNPTGSSFQMKEGGPPIEIVGVCADSKYAWIRQDDPPAFFVPYIQQKDVSGGMTFEIRTNSNPRSFVPAIREAVESVDKDLPLIEIRTQQEQIEASLAPERSFASVTSGFGALALLLASIGIYGVMAAAVSHRINEIGVRMALGARTNQVLRMVLGEATALAFAGVGVGLLAAFGLTRFLASFLYGLKPTDPLTFAASGIVPWLVAMAASWIPARRASHIQPVQALRHE